MAQRYSQIPGVDFTKNFAPVIDDATFRIVLSLMEEKNKMAGYAIDVDTAFLHVELEEEIFLKIPKGHEHDGYKKVLKLKKAIYGLVQAARQWWKKFNSTITSMGFKENNVDP